MPMNKHIAVAVALVVVGWTFWGNLFPALPQALDLTTPVDVAEAPVLSPEEAAVANEAWATFEQYLAYARARNLEGIKSLSHQISATCADPARRDECNFLMDSVIEATKDFRRNEFTNVAYDERQIVLFTDYIEKGPESEPTQQVLLFTRTETGEPRMLGIRFCSGEKMMAELLNLSCIETDPEKRDQDSDGWWDHVEALFYK